ncbi:multicopper oxidase family protein [Amycolatopsis thermophila]|uniref:FtsP/CotA-like multicopper oxidase with cupredoxin domain n=1 Tax=Amycolatopsis thermophila TaxID=206084 RepID=A0ABU0ER68_9PSEU|nr:multicopper oxidase domain-containing protein [Amycolatopsis thermophila]MDQ0377794.1 FtsP/CotA-like multicopper oxidase with cupredoxin domain [Amycolatopsis thermophila]
MTDVIARSAVTATGPHFGLSKFADPLRVPPLIRPHSWWHQDEITIAKTRARVRLHSQLPETEVWAYEGQFPGPTIEVRSGRRLRVNWNNRIDGTIPVIAVQQRAELADINAPARTPGYRNLDGTPQAGTEIIDGVSVLPAWTVVHLHGARTGGGNDGWAHNAVLRGASQLAEYPNGQQSATLWYHDHAMAVTRFNVFAGLAGMYLIRDAEEDALGLPAGDREIPLVLTDRNLDTDPVTGALTGQLLFKIPFITPAGPAGPAVPIPFTGPFNLVNGVIWPHIEVDARWYRFRVLNASSSRFYRLTLVDETGVADHDGVRIIGTDGGLLPAPAPLPAGGLVLAPAERADVLIDFSRYRGQNLTLRNTLADRTEPDIMQFRVEERCSSGWRNATGTTRSRCRRWCPGRTSGCSTARRCPRTTTTCSWRSSRPAPRAMRTRSCGNCRRSPIRPRCPRGSQRTGSCNSPTRPAGRCGRSGWSRTSSTTRRRSSSATTGGRSGTSSTWAGPPTRCTSTWRSCNS